jgi:GMP synthase (glutamine-hydrolysing)
LARVFGGSVVRDIENQELGICDVNITAAAKNDRLFHDLPDPFATFQGHNIRIETLPPDAILLAKTNVAIQAFTWPESNIYGTQLHPELRKNEFIERIKFYRDDYLHDEDGQAQFESLTNIDAETPEANSLVEKFVDRIVIPYWDKKETI